LPIIFRVAVLRILNILRVSISKSKEKVFTSECLTRTVESLQQKVEQLSRETYNSDKVKSTMAGMNVYFLIQSILDQQVKDTCLQDYQTSNVSCALTTPETTHGKSKVRSLLTQFRYIVFYKLSAVSIRGLAQICVLHIIKYFYFITYHANHILR